MAVLLNLRSVYREALGDEPVRRVARRVAKQSRRKDRKAVARSDDRLQQAAAQPHESADQQPAERTSRVRRKGGRVTRVDAAHEEPTRQAAKSAAGADKANTAPPANTASVNRDARSKTKRRVAAKATVETPSSPASGQPDAGKPAGKSSTPQATADKSAKSSSLCEPDDDQLEDASRRLSKAERKKLRKQRRRQGQ